MEQRYKVPLSDLTRAVDALLNDFDGTQNLADIDSDLNFSGRICSSCCGPARRVLALMLVGPGNNNNSNSSSNSEPESKGAQNCTKFQGVERRKSIARCNVEGKLDEANQRKDFTDDQKGGASFKFMDVDYPRYEYFREAGCVPKRLAVLRVCLQQIRAHRCGFRT